MQASASTALRGHAAIAQSKELAAIKAERDKLHQELELAERRSLIANRQIQGERDRRAALTATLKAKEEEISRLSSSRAAASEQAQHVEDAVSRLRSPVKKYVTGIAVETLRTEIATLEAEGEVVRDNLFTQQMDALARVAEVERVLNVEYDMRERLAVDDAERRAVEGADRGRSELELQARLGAAQEDAHTEGRRAAALEAALAAEVEARQRDMRMASQESDALRDQLMGMQASERVGWQQSTESIEARLAEAEAEAAIKASEAKRAASALHEAKAALASGSHAVLLLRIGARSIGTLKLRGVLHTWRAAATLIEHHKEAHALREEARASHGKLALLKAQRERFEASTLTEARKAEEEVRPPHRPWPRGTPLATWYALARGTPSPLLATWHVLPFAVDTWQTCGNNRHKLVRVAGAQEVAHRPTQAYGRRGAPTVSRARRDQQVARSRRRARRAAAVPRPALRRREAPRRGAPGAPGRGGAR